MTLLRRKNEASEKHQQAEKIQQANKKEQVQARKPIAPVLTAHYKEREPTDNNHGSKKNKNDAKSKASITVSEERLLSSKPSSPDMFCAPTQCYNALPYGAACYSTSRAHMPLALNESSPDVHLSRSPPVHWSPNMSNSPYNHPHSPFTASSTCFAPYSMSTSALPSPQAEHHPRLSPQSPQLPDRFGDPAVYDHIVDRMNAILESVNGDEYSLEDGEGLEYLIRCTDMDVFGRPALSKTPALTGKFKTKEPKESFKASKAWLYSNSRLPSKLPRLQIYTPTHPILCLAARHCYLSYSSPRPSPANKVYQQQPILVPASVRLGTRAMLLSVVPVDDKQNIVLAVRGTAGVFDWIANFDVAPESPSGFLDDEGNLVHSGFLAAARAMVTPLTERLRSALAENPARTRFSLIITGHSAGGAVASLLFCHMLSQSPSVASELKDLAKYLKRIHCITFGAPPLSLLPLKKPDDPTSRWKKSLFFSFVNEGDPIARITPGAAKNLLHLHALPAPVAVRCPSSGKMRRPAWKVPPISFCNAGRIIALRREQPGSLKSPRHTSTAVSVSTAEMTSSSSSPLVPKKKKSNGGFFTNLKTGGGGGGNSSSRASVKAAIEAASTTNFQKVEAVEVTDEQMRNVVFADPKMHPIGLYEARIKALAVKAVTAGLYDV